VPPRPTASSLPLARARSRGTEDQGSSRRAGRVNRSGMRQQRERGLTSGWSARPTRHCQARPRGACSLGLWKRVAMDGPYEVVIVGGGHNGLTAAAYLARAGRALCVGEGGPFSAAPA
jgi:hypothetical protein